jgi:hypothetical protein
MILDTPKGSTYQPTKPARLSSTVSKDIIMTSGCTSAVGSCNKKRQIKNEADRYGPFFFQLVPSVGFQLLRQPEKKIGGIEIAFDALHQRLSTNQARHHAQKGWDGIGLRDEKDILPTNLKFEGVISRSCRNGFHCGKWQHNTEDRDLLRGIAVDSVR